jgi:hypothetical protein
MMIHYDVKAKCREWKAYRAMAMHSPEILGISDSASRTLFSSLAWEIDGGQVFHLGPDQCAMFMDMDLSSVSPEDIRFPYDSFYVSLEGSGLALRASNGIEGSIPSHSLQGVYVTRRKRIQSGTRFGPSGSEVLSHSIQLVDPETGGHQTNPMTSLVFWAKDRKAEVWDDVMFSLSVLDRDVEVHGNYENAIRAILSEKPEFCESSCTDDDRNHNRAVAATAARMVFGLCAYIECREANVTVIDRSSERDALARKAMGSGKKAAKAERQITRIPSMPIRVVYPELRYSRSSTGKVSAHWRRAHTRMAWVGSKKDENGNPQKGTHRERRWIAATIVGEGDTQDRVYVV